MSITVCDDQVPGCNLITKLQAAASCDAVSIDESAILAGQVGYRPVFTCFLEDQVLAGESGILGVTKVVLERPSKGITEALQRH
jgi:hypothetical protein